MSGNTPFGLYDTDSTFQTEAKIQISWCVKGWDIQSWEFESRFTILRVWKNQ